MSSRVLFSFGVFFFFLFHHSGFSQKKQPDYFLMLNNTSHIPDALQLSKKKAKQCYRDLKKAEAISTPDLFINIRNICMVNKNNKAIKKIAQASLEKLIFNYRNSTPHLKYEVSIVSKILETRFINKKTKRILIRICKDERYRESSLFPLVSKTGSKKCLKKTTAAAPYPSDIDWQKRSDQGILKLAISAKNRDSTAIKFFTESIALCQKNGDHFALIRLVDSLEMIGGEVITSIIIDSVLMSDREFTSFDFEHNDFLLGLRALSNLISNWDEDPVALGNLFDANDFSITKKNIREWVQKNRKNLRYKN